MSLNQIIYKGVDDGIDETLSLKAYDMKIQNNLNVSLINGLPYTGGTINVGQPYDLIQTNAAGTAPEWTENIRINNIDIGGAISLDGSIPISDSIILVDNLGNPSFNKLPQNLIQPGPANTVMTTNSAGTISQWSSNVSVNGNLIFNGVNGTTGQYVKKSGGTQVWSNIAIGDITPGSNGQVAIVSGGLATWGNIPPTTINPGTPYQIVETNSAGNGVEWTSQYKGDSFLLTGTTTLQSPFTRYYRTSASFPLYVVPLGGGSRNLQVETCDVEYTIIGTLCNMLIKPILITSPAGGVGGYVAAEIQGNHLIPDILITPSNSVQSQTSCSTSQAFTTNSNPSYVNIYTQYYAFGLPFIEFVLNNAGTYDPNLNHGNTFVYGTLEFFHLKQPVTIQYYLN